MLTGLREFAYNEMSFMLIRLLQTFASFALDTASQPPETRLPASWAGKPGRKGTEQFWPKVHLTMYSHVRILFLFLVWVGLTDAGAGRALGAHGGGGRGASLSAVRNMHTNKLYISEYLNQLRNRYLILVQNSEFMSRSGITNRHARVGAHYQMDSTS